jgi:hypothetical protein
MTAPISDEELARLEADLESVRHEPYTIEGRVVTVAKRILGTATPHLIARLRSAEARAKKAEEERDEARAKLALVHDAADTAASYLGCGDNACAFIKPRGMPRGMATNGGCCCLEAVRPGVRASLGQLFRAAHFTGKGG